MKTPYIVIFVTTKDKKQAVQISQELLGQKLIACANVINGVQSMFRWQGKLDSCKEVLLILKTKRSLFKKVEVRVKKLHSYQTPEIIALPIISGSQDYLEWIDSSCV